jgi:hypothetical protein
MKNRDIYTYINMYWNNMKSNGNAVDMSFCMAINGMILTQLICSCKNTFITGDRILRMLTRSQSIHTSRPPKFADLLNLLTFSGIHNLSNLATYLTSKKFQSSYLPKISHLSNMLTFVSSKLSGLCSLSKFPTT